MKERVTAVILAAGQGKRMNSEVAKQLLNLKGRPVIYYSIKAFEESNVDDIILVVGNGQIEYYKNNIISHYGFKKVKYIIEGGKERYDSVYQGLKCIGQADYVLIHDGARPFITIALIESLVAAVKEYKACIIGTPVKETIKIVGQDGYIEATPNRDTLWAAQTPQAFDYRLIRQAYELFYRDKGIVTSVTDDAMVYEAFLNKQVKMLFGDYNNIKLTTPEDLSAAETIAESLLY